MEAIGTEIHNGCYTSKQVTFSPNFSAVTRIKWTTMTPQKCIDYCSNHTREPSYYAVIAQGNVCYCPNSVKFGHDHVKDKGCDSTVCAGNFRQHGCGGESVYDVYSCKVKERKKV
ncbi:hypothetical protein FRB98_006594 [Tulasnella sp. 332]|nr:hypothetical protein FRB98_006594 [Tulasnella sp. 332]